MSKRLNSVLGIGMSFLIGACSPSFLYNYTMPIAHLSYHVHVGESVERIFEYEGGNPSDSVGFLKFQKSIYNKTLRMGNGRLLRWKNGNLEIIKKGTILVPDKNRDGVPGKPLKKILRKNSAVFV